MRKKGLNKYIIDIYENGRQGDRHRIVFDGPLDEALVSAPRSRGYAKAWPLFLSKVTTGAYILALLLLVACGGSAHAADWTKADTAREATYLALHLADYSQTLYISDHPRDFHEYNPVLGAHPSRGEVNAYFIATGLLHPVVSYGLKKYAPDGWSEAWQWITIGVEVGAVGNNLSAGIGFSF